VIIFSIVLEASEDHFNRGLLNHRILASVWIAILRFRIVSIHCSWSREIDAVVIVLFDEAPEMIALPLRDSVPILCNRAGSFDSVYSKYTLEPFYTEICEYMLRGRICPSVLISISANSQSLLSSSETVMMLSLWPSHSTPIRPAASSRMQT